MMLLPTTRMAARSPHHPPRQPRLRRARPEVVCGAGHQRDGAGHRGHRLPVRAVQRVVHGHGSGRTNFGDTDRYDMLPAVARVFDLDTSSERQLWWTGPGRTQPGRAPQLRSGRRPDGRPPRIGPTVRAVLPSGREPAPRRHRRLAWLSSRFSILHAPVPPVL